MNIILDQLIQLSGIFLPFFFFVPTGNEHKKDRKRQNNGNDLSSVLHFYSPVNILIFIQSNASDISHRRLPREECHHERSAVISIAYDEIAASPSGTRNDA
jgi:hypothetical protein